MKELPIIYPEVEASDSCRCDGGQPKNFARPCLLLLLAAWALTLQQNREILDQFLQRYRGLGSAQPSRLATAPEGSTLRGRSDR